MRWLVDMAYLWAAVVLAPWLAWQSRRTGKYRLDWRQRRGHLPELPALLAGRKRVWIHAVSLGEINAVRGLIQAWRQRDPTVEIVVSTTTDTGIARAREIYADLTVIRYPLDFSRWVSRALDRIKPSLIVLVELEVWYQFVTLAANRGIPVAIVNGRLSERSLRRFAWIRPLVRRMFGAIAWVGAQDEDYARRFRAVGVPADRVAVTGSMKWDTAQIVDSLPGTDRLAEAVGLNRGRPVWVCGSTGPGEEAIILDTYASLKKRVADLQLVLVPRKPERFDEVAALIAGRGYACVRRTGSPDGGRREPDERAVVLGDTMGELRKFYLLADVVFVGRSIAAMGGSDMMEVSALAKPVVVGPHNENFADVVRRLSEGGGLHIVAGELEDPATPARLADAVGGLLGDRAAARAMGEAGRRVVMHNRGAIERTLAGLQEVLDRA